jgi:predicted Abi (CAAX) family protease
VPILAWAALPIFFVVAIIVAISSQLFEPKLLESELIFILPFSLFVFPSFLEEAFFRGVIIPRNTRDQGIGHVIGYLALSTITFVAWHPLNASTVNPSAASLFWDPEFLLIVAVLGATCSFSYIISRSLWVPVLIHWGAVVAWVFALGGRNLIL